MNWNFANFANLRRSQSLSRSLELNPSFRGDESSRADETSLLSTRTTLRRFSGSLAWTVSGLCDVPFLSMHACVCSGTRLYRSVAALRDVMKRHVKCSSSVYDERWLNELPRCVATRQPNTVFLVGVPGPNCRSATLIRSRSLRINSCHYLRAHKIWSRSRSRSSSFAIASNVHLVFLFDRFQFPLALRWARRADRMNTFQIAPSEDIANAKLVSLE